MREVKATDEFLITRHDKPIMFGLALIGVTWVDKEVVFDRPIDKIGSNLKLLWNNEVIDDNKTTVVGVVAHWKKRINKQARVQGKNIEDILLTCDFEEA